MTPCNCNGRFAGLHNVNCDDPKIKDLIEKNKKDTNDDVYDIVRILKNNAKKNDDSMVNNTNKEYDIIISNNNS